MRRLRNILKWTGIFLASVLIAFVLLVFILQNRTFEAPYPQIRASNDSTVIERGRYLVYGPAHCSGCHSPAENQERIEKGEELPLTGGAVFDLPIGKIYSSNLTPDPQTGIGRLTDQQIARALRFGVGHDGRALSDFMPFHNLSDRDLQAVIPFIRSQPAVKYAVPETNLNFIGKAIKAFVLKPVGPDGPVPAFVNNDTTAQYGKYLVNNVANCKGCHTDRNLFTGAYIGAELAGGLKFESGIEKGSYTVTPNLTPDPQTGRITHWSSDQFIKRFRQGRLISISEMPWSQFKRMNDSDLKAIYNYLHTLPPVKKDVGPTYVKGVESK